MNDPGQDFFLTLAGVAATLLGTFTVAAVFYIGSDTHTRLGAPSPVDRYWRSGMRWIFAAYSIPMLVGLTLASVHPLGGAIVFIVLTGALLAMTFDTGRQIVRRGSSDASTVLKVNEWVTAGAVVVAAVLPWVLGGWLPSPSSFILSLLLLLAAGLISTAVLVMAEFDANVGGARRRGAAVRSPAEPGHHQEGEVT